MKIDSSDAILASAVSGFGIIQLPTYITQESIDQLQLIPLLEKYTVEPEPIRIIYPSKNICPQELECLLITSLNNGLYCLLGKEKTQALKLESTKSF